MRYLLILLFVSFSSYSQDEKYIQEDENGFWTYSEVFEYDTNQISPNDIIQRAETYFNQNKIDWNTQVSDDFDIKSEIIFEKTETKIYGMIHGNIYRTRVNPWGMQLYTIIEVKGNRVRIKFEKMKNIYSYALGMFIPANVIMKSDDILKQFKKHKRDGNFYDSIETLIGKLKSSMLKSTNDDW
tara:strand:+ start:452 stop:1003 length:552 start_codon:yes stop_codon:yes gene_type:complete